MNQMKRLSIFIIFDKDNIIDDYEFPILDSLKDASHDMIIVSNSNFASDQKDILYKYTDKVIIRENKGLDAGAFKCAYDKYKELICAYDEVLLVNDTFYGPFVSFKKICDDMSERKIDFWGLTANYDSEDGYGFMPDNMIHSHIQTFFIAFRNNLLNSKCFQDYWDNYDIDKMNSFIDVVTKHELYFTSYLEKNGFKWDTYVNLDHYKSDDLVKNYNLYAYSAYSLIKYFKCPFIKRKNFVFDKNSALYISDGMDAKRALDYIRDNSLFDVSIIYNNLKRLYKPYGIYQGLNLNYVVSDLKSTNSSNLIIVNVCDERLYDISKNYFDEINKSEVFLITEDIKISKKLDVEYSKSITNYIKDNRDSFIEKYDNVCLLDLSSVYDSFQEISDSNIFRLLDNFVKSDKQISYISNILDNDIVDILFAPESLHNKNIMNITGRNKYLLENDVNVDKFANKDSQIIRLLNGVWFKSVVLSDIDDYAYTLPFDKFVGLFDMFTNNLYGKVYSKDYAENDIIVYENIIKSLLSGKECDMSYPNIMVTKNNGTSHNQTFKRNLYNRIKCFVRKLRRRNK